MVPARVRQLSPLLLTSIPTIRPHGLSVAAGHFRRLAVPRRTSRSTDGVLLVNADDSGLTRVARKLDLCRTVVPRRRPADGQCEFCDNRRLATRGPEPLASASASCGRLELRRSVAVGLLAVCRVGRPWVLDAAHDLADRPSRDADRLRDLALAQAAVRGANQAVTSLTPRSRATPPASPTML